MTEKDKAFSMIGEIAILILLEEFNTVVELLKSFPRNLLSDLWNPRFSVYYTAFYLSVIFKFSGKIAEISNMNEVLFISTVLLSSLGLSYFLLASFFKFFDFLQAR